MIREARISGGLALWDARGDLVPSEPWGKRRLAIRWIILHHSGALSRYGGLRGPKGAHRFCQGHRQWPGIPYHYWIPYRPMVLDGAAVVLRCVADDRRTWHTKGYPDSGLAVVLQGNLSGVGKGSQPGPSLYQLECLEGLIPWLCARLELDVRESLTTHYERTGKRLCPGDAAQAWVEGYRGAAA